MVKNEKVKEFGELAKFMGAEVLAAADAAIQLNPAFVDAYMNRALALEVLGRAEEAAAAYQRVLALRPDFSAAKKQLDRLRQMLSR